MYDLSHSQRPTALVSSKPEGNNTVNVKYSKVEDQRTAVRINLSETMNSRCCKVELAFGQLVYDRWELNPQPFARYREEV